MDVYVLRLSTQGFYYVGSTANLAKRLAQHEKNAKGFVALCGGAIGQEDPLTPPLLNNAFDHEMRETLARMVKHGFDNVRGWEFTNPAPLCADERCMIRTLITGLDGLCRRCGRQGHYASACTTSTKAAWLVALEGLQMHDEDLHEELAEEAGTSCICDAPSGSCPITGHFSGASAARDGDLLQDARGAGAQEHQLAALRKYVEHLDQPRGQFHMACGTGKTFVAVHAAAIAQRHRGALRFLVLVPSLALVDQMLDQWRRWYPQVRALPMLAVCTVGALENAPSTRDREELRSFLGNPGIVIATYHSLDVVEAAVTGTDLAFDLAMFDEAHRATGDGKMGTALRDERVPIKQRLFFTATPRVEQEEEDEHFQADRFGPVWYRLSLAQAAQRGLVVRYQVVLLVIQTTRAEVEEWQRLEESTRDDDSGDEEASELSDKEKNWLVNLALLHKQELLARAVAKSAGSRSVVFCSTNKRAQDFASKLELYKREGCEVHQVRGGRRIEREAALAALRKGNCAVTNCRCLQEGVDVPALDDVAVADAKKSVVDIVQLVGRVMRTAPGKTCGRIFVPVVKVRGNSELHGTKGFEVALSLLKALQQHDEELRLALADARERRGYQGELTATELEEATGGRVVIWDGSADGAMSGTARADILARAVQFSGASWDDNFGKLRAFKEENGHCYVPGSHPELGIWVSNQRSGYKKGRIQSERICKLDEIGFIWEVEKAKWDEEFSKLCAFKEKNGHCEVRAKDPHLSKWITSQRQIYKKEHMDIDHVTKLKSIGCHLCPYDDAWDDNFGKLRAFREENDHCHVPGSHPELGNWVSNQRSGYKKGSIQSERICKLDEIGFTWDVEKARWNEQFMKLVAFRKVNGHLDVPQRESTGLGKWLSHQRTAYATNNLCSEWTTQLQFLGVHWNSLEQTWQDNIAKIRACLDKDGNFDKLLKSDTKLWQWLKTQRMTYRAGEMPTTRKEQLEHLGSCWFAYLDDSKYSQQWELSFHKLCMFKEDNGHCNAADCPVLNKWVALQRENYRRSRLATERVAKLESLGFVWDTDTLLTTSLTEWDASFAKLRAFKEDNGHCDVPQTHQELGSWVNKQRQDYKKARMAPKRAAELEALGFGWDPLVAAWDDNFGKLRAFKKEHGHCNVPQAHPELGTWVSIQRQFYKKCRMAPERVAKLEELGFRWLLRKRDTQRAQSTPNDSNVDLEALD